MTRLWLALGFALMGMTLSAQTQHFIQWDPNPTTDQVTFYTLTFDATVFTVPPTIDATCNCIQQAVTVTSGSHTASVTATNSWGTSPATTLTFNANAAVKITNLRVK